MLGTFTQSITDTYTEARANYVMGKAYEDILGLTLARIITKDRADSIRRDILYLLSKKVLQYFELQFFNSDGVTEIGGLHYIVKADSTINVDDPSGRLDFWGLPDGTIVRLLVDLNRSASNIGEVDQQLRAWNYGTGEALSGQHTSHNSYSKDGFGLQQSIIGKW